MYRTKRSYNRIFLDGDVSGKRGGVSHDYVVIADFKACLLALELQVLWFEADGGKREHPIVRTNFARAADYDVRYQLAVLSHLHLCTNDAERPDREALR